MLVRTQIYMYNFSIFEQVGIYQYKIDSKVLIRNNYVSLHDVFPYQFLTAN